MIIHALKNVLQQVDTGLTDHRIDLISRLVNALIQVRSVDLQKLACSLSEPAKVASQYRRLQRFLSSEVSPRVLTDLIVAKLLRVGQPVVLVLDRRWPHA